MVLSWKEEYKKCPPFLGFLVHPAYCYDTEKVLSVRIQISFDMPHFSDYFCRILSLEYLASEKNCR
jgi:hypothetical protein